MHPGIPSSGSASRSRVSPAARTLIVAATSIVIGILWDISWHRTIGRDTFWTPAHLAIYLGGTMGGFTAAFLILRTTFFGNAEQQAASVKIWGFRGPLGAWLCAWGALAMLTSAPFDNWWHDAYGLDVKILSPPHTVLALGMYGIVIGTLLLVLREQNLAPPGVPPPGRTALLYAGGVVLVMVAVFYVEESWPNQQRNRNFYLISCAAYVPYLMALTRAYKGRWGATIVAAVYMAINAATVWVLPLFPGEPRLGPIHHPVDHFVPLAFPLLLVVPAMGIDLVNRWFGSANRWWQGWIFCVVAALVFTALFVVTQWYFSSFLIGPKGQNAFFGADRHWSYTENLGEDRFQYWSQVSPKWNVPATPSTFLWAGLLAFVGCRIGLWLGNWMARVRR